jgi:hypothetical protein
MGEASPFRWSVTRTVTLEPGEQRRQIAEELRALPGCQPPSGYVPTDAEDLSTR